MKKQKYKENRNNLVTSIEEARKQVIKNKKYGRILGDCKRTVNYRIYFERKYKKKQSK